MNRGLKFERLLQRLETCSKSIMYRDEINSLAQRIKQMDSIMRPLQFYPTYVFDETKHVVDVVAKEYLDKATVDIHHLVPVDVPGDGNCLYNSIVLLMNNPLVTASELRVRTVIELITNENYYDALCAQYAGNTDIIIQAACQKGMYSEIHEVAALCNVLQCNIRSVYPRIDFEYYKAIWDSVFAPIPPVIGNCTIVILWSSTLYKKDVRETYGGTWRPSHFVPLLSPPILNEVNSQSTSLVVTLEKRTVKNNTITQIRIPEFQSSPSRRRRNENNIGNDFIQTETSMEMETEKNDKEERRKIQLQKKRERSRSTRMNETAEQREIRLQKDRERTQANRMIETEEQREIRLQKDREWTQANRMTETEERREIRLQKDRERSQTNRANETEEERGIRLKKDRERTQTNRTNETEEGRRIRLQKEKERTQANRAKKKHKTIGGGQDFIRSLWPEPISRDLKETRLQQFLEQMSMSQLAEVTCAVCNIRTPAKDSKKIPISKILNMDLLKVSEELRILIKNSMKNIANHIDDNSTHTTSHIKNQSNFGSSSFFCENDIILYKNGLLETNR
ncbi:unnamed protein product, partial [Adineta ricciae]